MHYSFQRDFTGWLVKLLTELSFSSFWAITLMNIYPHGWTITVAEAISKISSLLLIQLPRPCCQNLTQAHQNQICPQQDVQSEPLSSTVERSALKRYSTSRFYSTCPFPRACYDFLQGVYIWIRITRRGSFETRPPQPSNRPYIPSPLKAGQACSPNMHTKTMVGAGHFMCVRACVVVRVAERTSSWDTFCL